MQLLLRRTINMSKKETPRPSKFIADSSPAGKKAGVRRVHDTKQHGGIVPLQKNPPRGIAWGKESVYGALIASTGDGPASTCIRMLAKRQTRREAGAQSLRAS
jgi:hypothetical protein